LLKNQTNAAIVVQKPQELTVTNNGGDPMQRISRNDPCPCGSGKKYKKCCLGKATALPPIIGDSSVAGAYEIADDQFVPAIACVDEATGDCEFVIARVDQRIFDSDDAAEVADDDLNVALMSAAESGDRRATARSLQQRGYVEVEAAGLEDIITFDSTESFQDLNNDFEDADDPFDETPFEELQDRLVLAVEQQIQQQRPPETRRAFVRLRRAGVPRLDAIDMLADVLLDALLKDISEGSSPKTPTYIESLNRLPDDEEAPA
jgi:hypothetical protein